MYKFLINFQAEVLLEQEVKVFDVRAYSLEDCRQDIINAFAGLGELISVRKAPTEEFCNR